MATATFKSATISLSRIVTPSVSTTLTAGAVAATDYVYIVTTAATQTLPTAVGNTNLYTYKNRSSAAFTIATTSSQTIDGGASLSVGINQSYDLISDGANWVIV